MTALTAKEKAMNAFNAAVKDRDILAADIAARGAAGETIPLNDFLLLEEAQRAVAVTFFAAATAN